MYIYGTSGNDFLIDTAGDDFLWGYEGDDVLMSLNGGNDTLKGGLGNDTYYINSLNCTIYESANEGIDLVRSTVSYTLGSNLENLQLMSGAGAINATGNTLSNVLYGNESNNILDGGRGADTMYGGAGDDTYKVENINDQAIERSDYNEGIDTVISSISYTLSNPYLENLTLNGLSNLTGTGNSSNNILIGNDGNNSLYGLAGDDTLNGGLGADYMVGGDGSDIYYVDTAGDTVVENTGTVAGIDEIRSSISFDLNYTPGVENLTLTGAGNISATGNAADNIISGNSGNNVLSGGAGNDTFMLSSGSDNIDGGTGINTISAQNFAYPIGFQQAFGAVYFGQEISSTASNIQNFIGTNYEDVFNGTSEANKLYGMGGDDTFYKSAGADLIDGGDGIDTMSYASNTNGDSAYVSLLNGISNGATSGIFNVENVIGSSNSDSISGNDANNSLIGGAGDDFLFGNLGDDTLTGGLGSDFLTGGAGSDTFKFAADSGLDTISDFQQGVDKIDLSALQLSANDQATFMQNHVSSNDAGSVISLGANTSVSVNINNLLMSDFIFS